MITHIDHSGILTERVDDESSVAGVETRGKYVGNDEFWSVYSCQDIYGHPHNDCQEHCKITDDMTNLSEEGGKEGGREGGREERREGGREGGIEGGSIKFQLGF